MAYKHIPIGDKVPDVINVVVEIPKGSHHKYEYDEQFDEIKLDRVLHSPLYYPTDYSFIPHTRSEDGDHLDALVFITDSVFPGCIVQVRPIGVLDMEDEAGKDWKIITVAYNDPRLNHIQDIDEINSHYKKEIEHFFEQYKKLENKQVKVGKWLDKKHAHEIIKNAMEKYKKESHH